MSRLKYFAQRAVITVFLLWAVITFLWVFFRLMPGDYTDLMMYEGADPATVEQFEENWGLNDPLYIQYLDFMRNLVYLDAGISAQNRRDVISYLAPRIFNTLILVAPAITLAYILGSIFGTVMGTDRNSLKEKYGNIGLIITGAIPDFFIAILLVIIFGVFLGLFPTGGIASVESTLEMAGTAWYKSYLSTDFIWHYTLPFTAIVLRYLYYPSLIMRTSVVETMNQDFTFYHRITGNTKFQNFRHIAKHSSLPVITVYPISMTRAIGGLVLVELVFNWPGVGYILVQSVLARDLPVVQFVFILIAVWIILANFVVDVLYGVIDPRVREGATA